MDALEATLLRTLQELPRPVRYRIAFSGGLDSTVLLHALHRLRGELGAPIHAVHVDHGLSIHSQEWSDHCRQECARLAIPCELFSVDARAGADASPEAAAREARYLALAGVVGEGEMLLTAHHQDDQAETLLLQLLRGGGPHGLAGMPQSRPFGRGWLVRPLLGFSRDELRRYAEARGLGWIDDPSNFDTAYDRNLLRHDILPKLHQWRPGIARVLARSAAHFAEAAGLLDALAAEDLERCRGGGGETLSVQALLKLEPGRCRNLLRFWLRRKGLPVADTAHLHRILCELLPARPDAEPLVEWPGAQVRRYRDDLYATAPLTPPPAEARLWPVPAALGLPGGLGELHLVEATGAGLRRDLLLGGTVTVAFRQGGERCRKPGSGHHYSVKKLFQESGFPPWERERIPLIFCDGELAAVAGLWYCEPWAARAGELGWVIEWRR